MDLEFTDDQRALHDALARIIDPHRHIPRDGATVRPAAFAYADVLEKTLSEGGYFDLVLTDGLGALEAALLVHEAAKSPLVMELGASALVAPLVTGRVLPRPIALARAIDLTRMVRFLDRAKSVLIDLGDDLAILPVVDGDIESVASAYAYPMGRYRAAPSIPASARLGSAALGEMRRLWRLSIALESAAAMRSALDFTVDYVKNRMVFGKPIGAFQAVQHRLAANAQRCEGVYWLAIKAAWSGSDTDAALAALYAQNSITAINFDLHQFNGALGFALEHSLHFWTFRLRVLQSELGGPSSQASAVAKASWG